MTIPEGWLLVPKEATQAMVDAVASDEEWQVLSHQDKAFREIWQEMIAAAPSPPELHACVVWEEDIALAVLPIVRSVCSDGNSDARNVAREVAAAIRSLTTKDVQK